MKHISENRFVREQPLREELRLDNSLKVAGTVGYLTLVGAGVAKLLGYDIGPAELLGPIGTAVATGALAYPVARLAQDYRDGII